MNRRRPCKHQRVVSTNKGKKRVTVNKNVKKRIINHAYASGIINNKRQDNLITARNYDKLEKQKETLKTLHERNVLEDKQSSLKRRVAKNNQDINWINKNYFEDNNR